MLPSEISCFIDILNVGGILLADARVELARLYEEFGDKETATRNLEEALAADTASARAWAALATIREDSGDYPQALANYQRSYDLNPIQPQIAERIAALQNVLGTSVPVVAPATGTRVVAHPNWVPRHY